MKITLNNKFIDLVIVLSHKDFTQECQYLLSFFKSELKKISEELDNLKLPENQKNLIEYQKINTLQIDLENKANSLIFKKLNFRP